MTATTKSCGVTITNRGSTAVSITVQDAYSGRDEQRNDSRRQRASPRVGILRRVTIGYDLTIEAAGGFRHQLAGHIENGEESFTDPAMGNPA